MPGTIASYAYLHARVSAMARRLLDGPTLHRLIQLPSGQEGDWFVQTELTGFRREEGGDIRASLEQRMISLLLADFVVLVRALSGAPRDFLIYWAHRFELSNLKAIMRGKLAGQTPATIRDQLVNMGPFASLPTDDLLRTEDIAELLRRLEGTPYSDIARQARIIYEERHDVFALDAAVDRRYYAGLAKRARTVERHEDGDLRRLMGSIIDRTNLLWLLRYRFAYALAPAEAYYLLIPAGYRLSGRDLLALSQLGSLEEVLQNLPEPFRHLLASAHNTTDVSVVLEQEMARTAQSVLGHAAFSLARVFAYLVLRETDLRQVRGIIRGRHLKLSPDLIRRAVGTAA